MSTIIDLTTPPVIELAFTWTPVSTMTYAPGGGRLGFTAPGAVAGVLLTFTATTTIINDVGDLPTIDEYHWDFGDGVSGQGATIKHRYLLANPYLMTVLRVTDSLGRDWYTRAPMYLR